MYFLQKFKMCRADHSINFSFTHLKFVKNITQFDLYFSCILWRLQNLKSEASFERITIKTIRHIFRTISDRFYYFASSFIIFSTSEISISSISAICSIENCSINSGDTSSKLHSINWNQQLPVATIYCRWFPDTADSFSEDYVYSLFGPPLHISHHLHLRHRHLIESVGCVSWYVPSLLDRGHIDLNSIHNFWS